MCFVFIWEQTAPCATYSINWFVFITEMKSVYKAVRPGSLNKAVRASRVKWYLQCLTGLKERQAKNWCNSKFSNTGRRKKWLGQGLDPNGDGNTRSRSYTLTQVSSRTLGQVSYLSQRSTTYSLRPRKCVWQAPVNFCIVQGRIS